MTGKPLNKTNEKPLEKDKIIFLNGFLQLIKDAHCVKFYNDSNGESLYKLEFKDGTYIFMKVLMELMSQ